MVGDTKIFNFKKMLRWGSRWGSSFRKTKKTTHNLRLSGIMPRPKSYKSSINLFEKKKKMIVL